MPSELPQIQRLSLETQVFDVLRQQILDGRLAGGLRLVQSEIAARLGVSRIPVRDAFRKLEGLGLVESDDRGNCFVRTQSLSDLREVYEIRRRLETLAAARAVARASERDIRRLEGLLEGMERAAAADDMASYVELNGQFHLQMYEASGSKRLVSLISGLWSGLPPLTPMTVTGQIQASLDQHREILALLKARDAAGVERAIAEHITLSEEKLIATFGDRFEQ